jgi:hypothetical protein
MFIRCLKGWTSSIVQVCESAVMDWPAVPGLHAVTLLHAHGRRTWQTYFRRLPANDPRAITPYTHIRCAHAMASDAYRHFLGNASDWRQYSDSYWFENTAGDDTRVYAWAIPLSPDSCATLKPWICEIPVSVYPCFPPPMPPPSPPSPPSPPAPPAPPSCKCEPLLANPSDCTVAMGLGLWLCCQYSTGSTVNTTT